VKEDNWINRIKDELVREGGHIIGRNRRASK
jgi:hypothetical protein